MELIFSCISCLLAATRWLEVAEQAAGRLCANGFTKEIAWLRAEEDGEAGERSGAIPDQYKCAI